MEQLSPPPEGDQNRGPALLAMFWTETAISIIILGMRMWSRHKLKNFGIDDWVMGLTVLFILTSNISITFAIAHGLGRHTYYLTPDQIRYQLLIGEYVAEPWSIMAIALGKVSVSLLILRIIGPATFWRKWIIYVSIPLVLAVNATATILLFAQCSPVHALWDGVENVPGAQCWKPNIQADFSAFGGSFDAALDVVLGILPITFVWGLNLPLKRKIALSCLLGAGILAGIAAAVKTSYILELNARSDLLWESYNLSAWTGAEIFVIIVCGSIPTLKPVWDEYRATLFKITKGKLGSLHPSQYPSFHSGSGSIPRRSYHKQPTGRAPWSPRTGPWSPKRSGPPLTGSTKVTTQGSHTDPWGNRDDDGLIGMQNINIERALEVSSSKNEGRRDISLPLEREQGVPNISRGPRGPRSSSLGNANVVQGNVHPLKGNDSHGFGDDMV